MVSSIGSSTASSMMQRLDTSQTSAKGAPPAAGGGGASPVTTSGSTSAASSTTQTYDPADTNQDGTVSAQELLAYLSAQASKFASANKIQSSDASVTKQMLTQAYGNSSQSASQPVSGTLSVTA